MPKKVRVLRPEKSKSYTADELTVTLDAKALAKNVAKTVAKHHRKAIRAGQRPSGGTQRALSPEERERAGAGKRSPRRGMGQEGRFPASIDSQARGGDLRASGEVAAVPFFDDWQQREHARGVEYFEADGDVDKLVDEVIEAELKRQGFT